MSLKLIDFATSKSGKTNDKKFIKKRIVGKGNIDINTILRPKK